VSSRRSWGCRATFMLSPTWVRPGSCLLTRLGPSKWECGRAYIHRVEFLKELDELIVRASSTGIVGLCRRNTRWTDSTKSIRSMLRLAGRFRGHIVQEVVPFLMANYSTRPERQAHCAGWIFKPVRMVRLGWRSSIETSSPQLRRCGRADQHAVTPNSQRGLQRTTSNPMTYRWKTRYDPKEVIGTTMLVSGACARGSGAVFGPGRRRGRHITANEPRRSDLEH